MAIPKLKKTGPHRIKEAGRLLADIAEWWITNIGYNTMPTAAHPFRADEQADYDRLWADADRKRALESLIRLKQLQEDKIADKLFYRLTDDGWRRALRDRITHRTALMENGAQCFILYDIPERHRDLRNMLRNFLKSAGFVYVQRSVWKTRRDVVHDLKELITIEKTSAWTRVEIVMP